MIAAISSPTQDDIIEKILRAKNLWDPPWLKKRPVRGPPSVDAGAAEGSPNLQSVDWDIYMDPPHPEDNPVDFLED
ncbi:MAG: hypothetical protein HY717_09985 [Planctomycetes bacterium]|nr:hypothetical protein [Planctomycetota bacterium]